MKLFEDLRLALVLIITVVAILGLLRQIPHSACVVSMGILGVCCFIVMMLTYKGE
jgi:hypothetical protein